ncbi:FMN-binding split barrel [Parasponia andersonii]|uniref:FMN-binding split barrel n=1 Tax=Parasponia andersonii TaxID=3476 RepID=A0A2P5C6G2_PARAD|nr:FMN-binding split barrel [Parasponia andersonii]
MKANKAKLLTFAEKCKNVLASNWQGHLNTIKADAKGSKADIYTSEVKYILKRGKPYIWVSEKELHNVNTIIDERASFSVTAPFPGPLATLLRSTKKLPTRAALTGDVVPYKDVKSAAESLREVLLSEQNAISESSYTVSGILSSSNLHNTSRGENLKTLLEGDEKSCVFIDGDGGTHEVDFEDMNASKVDRLAPLSARIIDGINQSEARRRGLMLFCLMYLNANTKDAHMLSIDRKGFDVLGKVSGPLSKDGFGQYQWREYRFSLKEEARDAETFCRQLVEMEEEAVKLVSSSSGLG